MKYVRFIFAAFALAAFSLAVSGQGMAQSGPQPKAVYKGESKLSLKDGEKNPGCQKSLPITILVYKFRVKYLGSGNNQALGNLGPDGTTYSVVTNPPGKTFQLTGKFEGTSTTGEIAIIIKDKFTCSYSFQASKV